MAITTLVAIRHAYPEDPDRARYPDDSLRPLNEYGIETQHQMAQRLREQKLFPDIIFTSPLLRARQTAEIIAEVFGSVPIKIEAALGDAFDGKQLIGKLPPSEKGQTVFFIGHAPTLAQFVNQLVGRVVLPAGLSRSGAIVIRFEKKVAFGQGQFIEYYKPEGE